MTSCNSSCRCGTLRARTQSLLGSPAGSKAMRLQLASAPPPQKACPHRHRHHHHHHRPCYRACTLLPPTAVPCAAHPPQMQQQMAGSSGRGAGEGTVRRPKASSSDFWWDLAGWACLAGGCWAAGAPPGAAPGMLLDGWGGAWDAAQLLRRRACAAWGRGSSHARRRRRPQGRGARRSPCSLASSGCLTLQSHAGGCRAAGGLHRPGQGHGAGSSQGRVGSPQLSRAGQGPGCELGARGIGRRVSGVWLGTTACCTAERLCKLPCQLVLCRSAQFRCCAWASGVPAPAHRGTRWACHW
jgi:hypothetical protein